MDESSSNTGELLFQINDACNRFEDDWKSGLQPKAEDYLAAGANVKFEKFLQELLPIEVAYRERSGSPLTVQECQERFPDADREWIEEVIRGDAVEATSSEKSELKSQETPQEIPNYELLEKIGTGGMGVIYKARQINLDRIVALKMLHDAHRDRERFRMEAEAVAGLTHPNIVSVFETGGEQGHLFFTMQYIDGCNLKEYIDQHRITADDAASVTETIAHAVHYAHQRGILHRDLKPANVLVDSLGQPHIADFGLAKQMERDVELTRSGTILGTPGYMAPEQASGRVKNLTIATDVYGIGAILYALLTGDAPFTGDTSLQILRRVIEEPPTSPRVFRRDLDRDLETICLKCLEKSPELRYASADELASDCSRYLNRKPVIARPVSTIERWWRWCRRNPIIAVLSAAVVVLFLATTIVSLVLAINQYKQGQLIRDIGDARNSESRAMDAATQTREDLYVATGMMRAQSGRIGEGVLWLSEAAGLVRNDPAKVRAQLVSCQSWMRGAPVPIAATILELGFPEVEQPGPTNEIHFRPSSPHSQQVEHLLCKSGTDFFLWDFGQKLQWHLNESFPEITCVTWSPNGDLLVTGSSDGTVRLVDPDFRTVRNRIRLSDPVSHLTFSSEGAQLVIANGNSVRFWNVANQAFNGDELKHSRRVLRVLFNRRNDRFVAITAGLRSSDVYVYSIKEGRVTKLFDARCQHLDNRDVWRPLWPVFVGEREALMLRERTRFENILDSTSGQSLGTHSISGSAYSRKLTADGLHTLTGGDNHLRICRVHQSGVDGQTSLQELLLLEHPNRVFAADVSPQGIIVTGGGDGTVRLWQAEHVLSEDAAANRAKEAILLAVLPHQTRLSQTAFSSDGTLLATAQTDGLIRIWKVPAIPDCRLRVAPNGNRGGTFAKLAGRSHWMISGMNKWNGDVYHSSIHLNSAFDDRSVASVGAHKRTRHYFHVLDASCSPDMRQIATVHAAAGRDGKTIQRSKHNAGTLRIWSFPDGKVLHDPLPMPSEPRCVEYRPDGGQLAVCTARLEIVLVDTVTHKIEEVLRRVDQSGNVISRKAMFPSYLRNGQLKFSPDGNSIAAWGDTDGLWLWDVRNRRPRFPCIDNGGERVVGVDFSPDGSRLAVACGVRQVARIVDPETGKLLCAELEHAARVNSVRFSSDGQRLLTGCADGRARVFDLKSGRLINDDAKHDLELTDAAFTPNSQYILTVGADNLLKAWHVGDCRLAVKPMRVADEAAQILVSPDSRYAIVAGGMPEVMVFDLSELQDDPKYDLSQLKAMSELMAIGTIENGTLLHLSTRQWHDRWLEFSTRYGR